MIYIQSVPKKRTNKTNKNGRLVNIPKWSELVNLDVFDNLGPILAHLDTFGPFQTKINLLPQKDKVGFGRGAFEQIIIFCLKWPERVQTGQKGPQLIKNI